MNAVDIVIIVALGAAVALIVRRMVRNRRQGKGGCSCGCSGCTMNCSRKK